jgi:hypothetical protein
MALKEQGNFCFKDTGFLFWIWGIWILGLILKFVLCGKRGKA